MQRPPSHQYNPSQFYAQGQPSAASQPQGGQPGQQPQTINPAAFNFPGSLNQQQLQQLQQQHQLSAMQGNNRFQGMTPQMLAAYSQRFAQSQHAQQQQAQTGANPGQIQVPARPGTTQPQPGPGGQQQSQQIQQGFNPAAFQLQPGMMQNQSNQPQQFINPAQLLAGGMPNLYQNQSQQNQAPPNGTQQTPPPTAQGQNPSSAPGAGSQQALQSYPKYMAVQQAMQLQHRMQQHQRSVSGGASGSDGQPGQTQGQSSQQQNGQPSQSQGTPQGQGNINPMALMNPPGMNNFGMGIGMGAMAGLQGSAQGQVQRAGSLPAGGAPGQPSTARQQQPGQAGSNQAQGQAQNHQRQSSQTRTPTPHQSHLQTQGQPQGQTSQGPPQTPIGGPPQTPHTPHTPHMSQQGYPMSRPQHPSMGSHSQHPQLQHGQHPQLGQHPQHPQHVQHGQHPQHPQLAQHGQMPHQRPSSVASHHSHHSIQMGPAPGSSSGAGSFEASSAAANNPSGSTPAPGPNQGQTQPPGNHPQPSGTGSIGRPGSAQSLPPGSAHPNSMTMGGGNRPPSAASQIRMGMGSVPPVIGYGGLGMQGGMNMMSGMQGGMGMQPGMGGMSGMNMPPGMGMGMGGMGMNVGGMGGMNIPPGMSMGMNVPPGMQQAQAQGAGGAGGMMPPPLPPSHGASYAPGGVPPNFAQQGQGQQQQGSQQIQLGQQSPPHQLGQPQQQQPQQQQSIQIPQRPPTRPQTVATSNPMVAQPDLAQMHGVPSTPQQGQHPQHPGQPGQGQGGQGMQNRGGTAPPSLYPGGPAPGQGPTVPSSAGAGEGNQPGMGYGHPGGGGGVNPSGQNQNPIIGPDGFPHFPGQPQPILPMGGVGIPGHPGVPGVPGSAPGSGPGPDGLPSGGVGLGMPQMQDMSMAQAQAQAAQMRGSVPPSSAASQIRSRGPSQPPGMMLDGQRHGTPGVGGMAKTEAMEIGVGGFPGQRSGGPPGGVPGHPGMNGFPGGGPGPGQHPHQHPQGGPPHLSINMNNVNMGMGMKMGGPGSAMSAPGGQLPSAIGKPPMGHGPPGSATGGPDGRMLNAAMQHHQQQQQQQQQALANLPPGTDPARTRVTEIPLANSGTLIPPLSPKSIEELKAIVKRDDEHAVIKRDLDTRMREELSTVGGPQAWWEKDTVNMVPPTQKFGILWPGDKRRAKEKMKKKMGRKEMIRLPRKLNPKEADLPEILVPIRLEFDVDQHKFKETFLWNLNDPIITPEFCAQSIVDDYKMGSQYFSLVTKSISEQLSEFRASISEDTPMASIPVKGCIEEDDATWWGNWRKRLRTEKGYVKIGKDESKPKRKSNGVLVKRGPDLVDMDIDIKPSVGGNLDENERELRVILKLDIVVGTMKLDDQFEWDVADETNSPELFAEVYTNELGLSGEFKTAVAHSIREQLQTYEKSLVMLGNPTNVAAIVEPDFKDFFLPAVTSSTITRNAEMAASFTPFLNVVDEIELAIGTEKERNKRRNKTRQTMRRRPNALPDRDAIRTHRTPAIGFPENDPTTLINGAMNNSTPATGRRAAAVAASSTIASMVASENGGVIMPTPDRPQINPVPVQKSSKVRGLFKAPAYSSSVLKPRSRIEGAIASTALIKDTPAAPKADVDDEGNPLVAVTGERRATNKVPSAKRQKELEREEKEREYAKRQHANMVDGVWHCSNCGCPDDIAIGRRKGPLGDKSQCGECGKYYHRYRKPREVVYNTDREYHLQLRDRNSKNPRIAAAARAAAASATPAATPMEDTPISTPNLPTISVTAPQTVDGKTPSSRGSSSEPLAQSATKVKDESVAPEAPPAPPVPEPSRTPAPPPTTTIPATATKTSSKEKPEWLSQAHDAMLLKFVDDRFDFVLRASASDSGVSEWWVKCLDCPQKFYRTGPDDTLNNFEIHLRNRGHRRRVAERVNGSSPQQAASS